MRYLDPKNDLTFKKIFGEHPNLLKSFLNAVMPFEKGRFIDEIHYLPAEQVPVIPKLRNSLVDVKCKDNFGRYFIIEMQMYWTDSFKSRVLFNASKAFVRQLDKGIVYKSLDPVYSLNLINQNYTSYKDKFYHHYSIVDIADTNQRLDGLQFVFIELLKFKPKTIVDKKMMVLWLRFLTEIKDNSEIISHDFQSNSDINQALEILQESSFTVAELEEYDRYWDIVSTERSIRLDFEEKVKEQEEKVKEQEEKVKEQEEKVKEQEEKVKEQKEKVKEQEEKVKEQEEKVKEQEEKHIYTEKKHKEEKLNIAMNLLKNDVDIDIIVSSTGLSTIEIENLKKNIS